MPQSAINVGLYIRRPIRNSSDIKPQSQQNNKKSRTIHEQLMNNSSKTHHGGFAEICKTGGRGQQQQGVRPAGNGANEAAQIEKCKQFVYIYIYIYICIYIYIYMYVYICIYIYIYIYVICMSLLYQMSLSLISQAYPRSCFPHI